MKKTLLIALLGATVTLATPTLSYADNGYKFQSKALDRDHRYKHKHGHKHNHNKSRVKSNHRHNKNKHKNRQFVFNKHGYNKHGYNKYGFNRHGYNKHGYNRHGYNKHGYNKHGYNRHGYTRHAYSNNDNSSFSISWNIGDSTISYGNDHYNSGHNYNKHRGKKIYKRINNQANRIQRGINNGQLVKREVRKLRHEQRHIKNTLAHYKHDGHLNRYERSKMNQLLDIASNNIHRKSNNRLTRYSRNYNHYVYY